MTAVELPPAAESTEGEEWRRLSSRMLLVHPVRELAKVLPLLLPALLFGRGSGHHNNWALVVTALAVTAGLLRWYTTRYRIGANLVELRHGILILRHISVPADRVRTVDLTANAAHRLLGLATVTVGTGQAAQRRERLKLDALLRPEAVALRESLLGTAPAAGAGTAAPAPGTPLLRFSPGWLRFAPIALAGFAPVLAVGLAMTGPAAEVLKETPAGALVDWLLHVEALGPRPVRLPLVLLLAATAINVVTFTERTFGFTLVRRGGGALEIGHGLVNRRTITLEKRRVYGVELAESLPMRLMGGARCTAVATGLHRDRGGPALAPATSLGTALGVAEEVLGASAPVRTALTPHGPAARSRRLTRALAGWALGAVPLGALTALGLLPVWTLAVWGALLPATVPLARDRYRSLGHAVRDGYLVVRSGSLIRRRAVLAAEGVIGWNVRRSWSQRRAGLVTLTATTAAGRRKYAVLDLPAEQVPGLAQQVLPGLLTPFLVPDRVPAQPTG